MKVAVNKDKCLACGVCETAAPDVFRLGDESYAIVLLEDVPANLEDAVKQAIDDCPEQAIETL
jgi:ferredoxin